MSLKVTKLIRLTILMGLLLSMSLLTGCGNKKEIVFWNPFTGLDGEIVTKMVDDFNATNPEYTITNVPLAAGDIYTKVPLTRVPFGDLEFVRYVMSVDPERKRNRYGKGKYLLRHAFEEGGWLPQDILWREKAAFSDAVGHSLVDDLKEYAEQCYTDDDFQKLRQKYVHARPFTKESLLYREIFEKYYPGQSGMVLDFWMPNREWEGCDVDDPSARVLANYGQSGV